LARVKTKVDWDLEIGGIAREVLDQGGPVLLFENINDHEETLCTKLFMASLGSFSRAVLMLGLSKGAPYKDLIKVWREQIKKHVKPAIVSS
jgi:4-hydroxy-3-polyprenylbenzoate decarboxylase